MPADALAVHGLTAEFLADKPLFAAVADGVLAFVGDTPLVAHNAGFDITFLNVELRRAAKPPKLANNLPNNPPSMTAPLGPAPAGPFFRERGQENRLKPATAATFPSRSITARRAKRSPCMSPAAIGRMGYLMSASNQIFLVVDAGTPVAAFTVRREMQAYLKRRLDTFVNPLVYTFWGNQGPSIMTMTAALAE
jgi:hypothetical protein